MKEPGLLNIEAHAVQEDLWLLPRRWYSTLIERRAGQPTFRTTELLQRVTSEGLKGPAHASHVQSQPADAEVQTPSRIFSGVTYSWTGHPSISGGVNEDVKAKTTGVPFSDWDKRVWRLAATSVYRISSRKRH